MNRFALVVKPSALLGSLLAASGFANAALPEVFTTALAAGVADVLLVIAAGGAAIITVKGAGVVWNVGARFVSKLGRG